MDSMLYLIGSRMNGLTEGLDVTASNLANASTPGFKRTQGKFRSILQASMQSQLNASDTEGLSLHWPDLTGWRLDLSQGATRRTGRPLDLAIQGKAFFALETPAGERYTRKGRARLNEAGELTDASGNRFASESGSIRVPASAGAITVAKDGEVGVDGQGLGRLRLVDIPQPQSLVSEGAGIYRNDGPAAEPAMDSLITQGAVEGSNVNTMEELVGLVRLMRAYEASARVMKRWDALSNRLIQTAA